MLASTEKQFPEVIDLFPGLQERVYFQHPETKEYWFHASNVCRVMGFSNPTSALALHCEEDEKLMEVVAGRQTWFVSEAGIYGLAFGSKAEIALSFKRWLKHKVLPKLRADGGYIMPNASSEQLKGLTKQIEALQRSLNWAEEDKGDVSYDAGKRERYVLLLQSYFAQFTSMLDRIGCRTNLNSLYLRQAQVARELRFRKDWYEKERKEVLARHLADPSKTKNFEIIDPFFPPHLFEEYTEQMIREAIARYFPNGLTPEEATQINENRMKIVMSQERDPSSDTVREPEPPSETFDEAEVRFFDRMERDDRRARQAKGERMGEADAADREV